MTINTTTSITYSLTFQDVSNAILDFLVKGGQQLPQTPTLMLGTFNSSSGSPAAIAVTVHVQEQQAATQVTVSVI